MKPKCQYLRLVEDEVDGKWNELEHDEVHGPQR